MTVALLACLDCTAGYSVGAPRCPHCGSERRAEEGTAAALGLHVRGRVDEEEDTMPKISKHGGATTAGADATPPASAPAPAAVVPAADVAVEAAERPAEAAPKSAWLEYAASLGVDGAEEMTKKQLIDATMQGVE